MSRASMPCPDCPAVLTDRPSMSAKTRWEWHQTHAHNAPSPESRHAGFEEVDPVDALDLFGPPAVSRPDCVSRRHRIRFRFWEVA